MTIHEPYWRYWGKARSTGNHLEGWHPLACHSLDVAAVAAEWLASSTAMRRIFPADQETVQAWIPFFMALHDFGKFDLRFQWRSREALRRAWPDLDGDQVDIKPHDLTKYHHGPDGLHWFAVEHQQLLPNAAADPTVWDYWWPWMAAVTGHHGALPEPERIASPRGDKSILRQEVAARRTWCEAMAGLFLAPHGLSLASRPPPCPLETQQLLAGFCSVADWIGSGTAFGYVTPGVALEPYYQERRSLIRDHRILYHCGLLRTPRSYPGMPGVLTHPQAQPRGVQTLMDDQEVGPGLRLIEAPTGSGKTEAALALAWRLLADSWADSILFALPSQATANAMLQRVEHFAKQLYDQEGANVVLAHGKSGLHPEFRRLIQAGRGIAAQGNEEGNAQCAEWLVQSRKRVFLGQIGVCTIDQVLLSVLPIRHHFVRSFGIHKSVLIVDKVHAYDTYMNGLLGAVLHRQRTVGGSAILLSATLPLTVREELLKAWGVVAPPEDAAGIDPETTYPLVTHARAGTVRYRTVAADQAPLPKEVTTECLSMPKASPDEAMIGRLVAAAAAGALVGVVCNLVDEAQTLARRLRQATLLPVDLFHARHRFQDRQDKEQAVGQRYGREASRQGGRLLVATQVVEQSLDLDFDWLVTQICPVDLLFQRLGRLHRHEWRTRPPGFQHPRCTVLTVIDNDYCPHDIIYGNPRVLWRTEQRLRRAEGGIIRFPEAYRAWINDVYERWEWEDEPESITMAFEAFLAVERARGGEAERRTRMTMAQFADDVRSAASLTRDSPWSLDLLPHLSGDRFLDGTPMTGVDRGALAERFNLETVGVPASWNQLLRGCPRDEEQRFQLLMDPAGEEVWIGRNHRFRYSREFGMEKGHDETAD